MGEGEDTGDGCGRTRFVIGRPAFGPVDRGFPEDGVLARGALDEPGWVLATLDPARIEAVRADGGVRNHRDWPAAPFPIPLPGRFA